MYIPTTKVLEKTLIKAFEIAKQQEMKNYALTGIDLLYLSIEMKNGNLDLAWLGDVPAVKKWVGSKIYGDLSEYEYSLQAEDFYDGFSIHKKALRRGELGSIKPRIEQLARNLNSYEAELIVEALVNGTVGLAYDGSAFFANRSVNDNLAAGTGVSIDALTADLATNRRAMQRFVTDAGRYTRQVPDTIICPTELEPLFLQIKNSTDDPSGTNRTANPYGGWIKNVIALPDLDDANDWYLTATQYSVKPFVFGFEKLENGQKVLPTLDDSRLASDGVYGYSAELSGKPGYGLPTLAIKVVNA